jgi:uncharacterized protein (TIGR00251 family)
MNNLKIEQTGNGVVFCVKVVPASSKTAAAGILYGMLKVKIAAPPEKGKANKSLIEFLSDTLGVKKNCVTIISGQTGSVKKISISGISAESIISEFGLNSAG